MATTRLLSAMVATWNNVATTFTGLKLNVTDTASASGSLLMDLQVGGVSRLTVNKTGRLSGFSGGAVLTNALSANGNIDIPDANFFYWNTRTRMSSGADGAFTIANVAATSSVTFTAGASNLLTLNGGLTTGSDLTVAAGGGLGWVGRSRTFSLTDGNVTLYNNALSSFGLLQFGGTTSAFPAIKRNGATFDFRLADDSAFASITANSIDARSNISTAATGVLYFTGRGQIKSPDTNTINFFKSDGSTDANVTAGIVTSSSYVKTQSTTVASLTAAATAGASARSFVTDALGPTFGAAVVGGGAVKVPVYSDGVAWLVG